MNLLEVIIDLVERGHSEEYITFVLRKKLLYAGKTEEEITLWLGEFNGNT